MNYTINLERFQCWLLNIFSEEKIVYLLLFFTAFIIRLLPELIVPSYPIGFETITYYAPAMTPSSVEVNGDFFGLLNQFLIFNPSLGQFLRSGPLFYVPMWAILDLFGADPLSLLKIVGPFFYGFLCLSFCFFVRKGLNLDVKVAFFVAFFLIFQIPALRLS
ncbi:MAG: hypothetical protein AC479_07300, partial [miscellaneous Crenarchaeota group-6 archaeon AD8-1]